MPFLGNEIHRPTESKGLIKQLGIRTGNEDPTRRLTWGRSFPPDPRPSPAVFLAKSRSRKRRRVEKKRAEGGGEGAQPKQTSSGRERHHTQVKFGVMRSIVEVN